MIQAVANFFRLEVLGKRVFGLDVLRTIAIMLVLIGHSRYYLPEFVQEWINLFLVDGVAIFFVLSGFLIGGIMIKTFQNGISWKKLTNFWTRRWMRTLPNYYLILIVLLIIELLIGGVK